MNMVMSVSEQNILHGEDGRAVYYCWSRLAFQNIAMKYILRYRVALGSHGLRTSCLAPYHVAPTQHFNFRRVRTATISVSSCERSIRSITRSLI